MAKFVVDIQRFAKARGNIGWLGIAASGTSFDCLEGKTDISLADGLGEIDATDADNNDATRYGNYKDFINGDAEATFIYTANYSGASAQELLLTTLETGAAMVMAWGNGAAPTTMAVTDYKTASALVTKATVKCDAGVQTISATIRINAAPTVCAGTETLTTSAVGTAGKARGTRSGGAYLQVSGVNMANILSLTFDKSRGEIESTDADSSGWKTFLYGDYEETITGSLNYAETTEQEALRTAVKAGSTLTNLYGFRAYSAGVGGRQKWAVTSYCTKFDIKFPHTGVRTADFTLRVKGVPTRTA